MVKNVAKLTETERHILVALSEDYDKIGRNKDGVMYLTVENTISGWDEFFFIKEGEEYYIKELLK